jgi:hypothetical protein
MTSESPSLVRSEYDFVLEIEEMQGSDTIHHFPIKRACVTVEVWLGHRLAEYTRQTNYRQKLSICNGLTSPDAEITI